MMGGHKHVRCVMGCSLIQWHLTTFLYIVTYSLQKFINSMVTAEFAVSIDVTLDCITSSKDDMSLGSRRSVRMSQKQLMCGKFGKRCLKEALSTFLEICRFAVSLGVVLKVKFA